MKYDYLFFSPHLDDAVLSCAGLISELTQKRNKVCVITIFAGTDIQICSSQAEKFVFESGQESARTLFRHRRIEDEAALKQLRCDKIHLDYIDALFRTSTSKDILIPLYTHEKDLFSSKPNIVDMALLQGIKDSLYKLIFALSKRGTLLYAPLGSGGHVDHILVRDAVISIRDKLELYLWEDVPYRAHHNNVLIALTSIGGSFPCPPQRNFVNISKQYINKQRSVHKYKSQLPGLYAHGLNTADFIYETYYTIR